jgi:hypothetical protein
LSRWNVTSQNGTVGIVSKDGGSVLHATQNARPAGATSEYAYAAVTLDGAWRHVVVEFDMLVEKQDWLPGMSENGVFAVSFKSVETSTPFYLGVGRDDVALGLYNFAQVQGHAIDNDVWLHVRVDVDPAGSLSGAVGNQTFGPVSFQALMAGQSPYVEVRAGIHGFNSPTPPYSVYYDNVAVDFAP